MAVLEEGPQEQIQLVAQETPHPHLQVKEITGGMVEVVVLNLVVEVVAERRQQELLEREVRQEVVEMEVRLLFQESLLLMLGVVALEATTLLQVQQAGLVVAEQVEMVPLGVVA